MELSSTYRGQEARIGALFAATFSVSAGEEEGALIGDLAKRIMQETAVQDLHVFTAWKDGALAGGILFSRLAYDQDSRAVFVLGPVAVATDRQGQGIGKWLISCGLKELAKTGVDVVATYGDPAYYSRSGFAPISEADMPAPFKLRYPEGWLAQSLSHTRVRPFTGRARCVPAFNDPEFW